MAEPFYASGDKVFVDPGENCMKWIICRVEPYVDPSPAEAAKAIAAALNAHEPARKAVLRG